MENELLKEPWIFSHVKTSPKKEEDITAFSAWEENFQDLSDWCMDTFQGQCDFRIGESTTFKLSGTKNEDKDIRGREEEEGTLKGLKSTLKNDDKCNSKMHKIIEKSTDDYHNMLLSSPSGLIKEYTTTEYHNEENNISSSWLMSPESTASTSNNNNNNNNTSSKRCSTDISVPLESECRDKLDYVPTTMSLGSISNQRETWDELRTIETAGLDTFDLLSYVCDDEIRSPEGSVVSTDSSAVLQVKELTTIPSVFSSATVKIKTEETNELPARRRMGTRATSTTSSSIDTTPVISSQRSRRIRSVNKKKERCTTMQTRRQRSGTKRYYESDSDDNNSTVSQYRESREKNNEASRKSRMNKKAKESEMATKATDLERDNRILKMKVEELEKLVTSMRSALLRSALKKEF